MIAAGASPSFRAEFEAVCIQYRASLPERWQAILQAWQACRESGANGAEAAEPIRLALHRLAGASETFRLTTVAQRARVAEDAVRRWEEASRPETLQAVEAGLDALGQAVAVLGAVAAPAVPSPNPASQGPTRVAALSFEVAERIGPLLRGQDILLEVTQVPLMDPTSEAAVVIGSLDDWRWADVERTADLGTGARPRAPRVALLPDGSFRSRLEAVRSGCHAILVEPIESDVLVEAIDELGRGLRIHKARVMIVDEDEGHARSLASVLAAEGMTTAVVARPAQVLDRIRAFRPDVLMADLHMPGCSGFELAAVLRQDPSWLGLPILFFTTDHQAHFAALQTEGDGFIAKSEPLELVVDVIRAKALRARKLDSGITRDGLTGLLRHAHFMERAHQELSRCRRSQQPAVCAMLDLDHFKQVNDRHGHAVGDAVIRRVARQLRQRFRSTDLVGRYGGEEFAVLLPNTWMDDAHRLLDELREAFARDAFDSGTESFHCSFSAGLASFPEHDGLRRLVEAADEALYAAKRCGRNRVFLSR